jgi:hypothetical protein
MKNLIIFIFALTLTSCSVSAQQSAAAQKLTLTGCTLPAIRHIIDMKITGDTIWFAYETEGGYGQRFLRRAIIDSKNHTLNVGPEMGHKGDGYYVSYMPYPVNNCDSTRLVVSQDDGEVYRVENDSVLSQTKKYIFSDGSSLPFQLSQYVQDVSMVAPDRFVFIGREPNGGTQYALKANITTAQVDTIRRIQLTPELISWMPNAGELAYSNLYDRLAFAYRLHPMIEIFGMDGKLIKQVRICEDTFNSATLKEADFEDQNPLHIVDIATTPEHIYALHWNFKYADAEDTVPTIFKIDWDGKIVDRLFNVPMPLYKIAVGDDNSIIGWNGKEFIHITSF